MANETFGTVTIIDDVGANANSYVSVSYIKSQWSVDPNKVFSSLTDEDIAKLAIYATSIFDAELWAMYDGDLFNTSYALFWPRANVQDSRGVRITDMTVFPNDLKKAVAEQSWYLNDNDVFAQVQISGVKQQVLEGVGSKTFYDLGELRSALSKSIISDLASKLVSPLLIGQSYGSKYSNHIVRG